MPKHQGINPAAFLNERDREIIAAERKRAELDRYIAGLRAAREAMAGIILDGATQPSHRHSDGSRVAVLKEILEQAPEPMAVDDIMAELKKRGRLDEKHLVYSTISYMKRVGEIKNVERGKWSAATQQVAA